MNALLLALTISNVASQITTPSPTPGNVEKTLPPTITVTRSPTVGNDNGVFTLQPTVGNDDTVFTLAPTVGTDDTVFTLAPTFGDDDTAFTLQPTVGNDDTVFTIAPLPSPSTEQPSVSTPFPSTLLPTEDTSAPEMVSVMTVFELSVTPDCHLS